VPNSASAPPVEKHLPAPLYQHVGSRRVVERVGQGLVQRVAHRRRHRIAVCGIVQRQRKPVAFAFGRKRRIGNGSSGIDSRLRTPARKLVAAKQGRVGERFDLQGVPERQAVRQAKHLCGDRGGERIGAYRFGQALRPRIRYPGPRCIFGDGEQQVEIVGDDRG
jgi:hypothetical protein